MVHSSEAIGPAEKSAITERATCCGEEDKTRSGNWTLNASLEILRVALILVEFRLRGSLFLPGIFEQRAHSTVPEFRMLKGKDRGQASTMCRFR
ncbi:MAG: hypothetical protein Q8Q59_03285 [Luteolibacter sp.]|nr:hypothetical protein [Luteolibacter sp.]